ncbi:unnamed protein product [Linum trigynum]|uniref:RING-type domain-containing protein n=1 Tax=Linum trigynum TaxID=586398 RepID=A0AAV2DNT5_9ROSI
MNASANCTQDKSHCHRMDWPSFWRVLELFLLGFAIWGVYSLVKWCFCRPPSPPPPPPSRRLGYGIVVFKRRGEEEEEEEEEEVDEEQGRRRSLPEECSICLDKFKDGDVCSSLLVCHHLYHKACFDPWLTQNPHCPLCRASVH